MNEQSPNRHTLPKVLLALFASVVAVVVAAGVTGAFQVAAQAAPASAAPTAPATAAPAPRPAPTTARAVPVAPTRSSAEIVYLAVSGSRLPGTSEVDRLAYASIICTNLDKYPSKIGLYGTVKGFAQNAGISDEDAAFVVGAAVSAMCPRHADLTS